MSRKATSFAVAALSVELTASAIHAARRIPPAALWSLQGRRRLGPPRGRFIPAPAGNGPARTSFGSMTGVHPRACGERWAKDALVRARVRFIPAPAGNGFSQNKQLRECDGSSPRPRGTATTSTMKAAQLRFIPAPAGNGDRWQRAPDAKPVHPRACGERAPNFGSVQRSDGSSPRLRGTAAIRPPRQAPDRSSPRLRGTDEKHDLAPLRCRFIPAPAGNGTVRKGRRDERSVHPRACGERQLPPARWADVIGSSPRLRGTDIDQFRAGDDGRFIPAPAGNGARCRSASSCPAVHPRACGERSAVSSQ